VKMNQCCLYKNEVLHERGKRNQTQMAWYIFLSGKGCMVANITILMANAQETLEFSIQ
jgi:hypothetical protein